MTVQVSVPGSPPQLYSHGASDFRPYAPASGGGGGFFPFAMPTSPVTLPNHWMFYGDSQTGGRATEFPSALSHHVAFTTIWNASGFSAPTTNRADGDSGASLASRNTAFDGDVFSGTPWIHSQESGGTEDLTPEQFGDVFEAFMRDIYARYPQAVISYESPYSFQRLGETGRDWETTQNWADWGYPDEPSAKSFNEVLYERIQVLRDDSITVYPVYTCEYINELVSQLGYPAVILETNPYHYDGIGNFMIALAMFKGLGYNVSTLNTSTITINQDPSTNTSLKATCVNIINTLGA